MDDTGLVEFQSLTAKTAQTDALVRATYESFELISPWARAKSDNAVVQSIMGPLRDEAKRFFHSTAQSYEIAQAGYAFSTGAAFMCKSLLDPSNTDSEIRDLIQEMRKTAQEAHNGAKHTAEMFRENRMNFNAIISEIPDATDSVQLEHKQMETKKTKTQRKADSWGNMVDKLSPFRRKKPSNGKRNSRIITDKEDSSDESTRNPFHVAGALLSLPVTLPLVMVAKSRKNTLEAQVQDISNLVINFGTALEDLKNAQEKLYQLMDKMNIMADYWSSMEIVLRTIDRRVTDLRMNTTLRLKIKSLASEWNQVGNEYGAYMTQLDKLRDLNPSFRAITEQQVEMVSTAVVPDSKKQIESTDIAPESKGGIVSTAIVPDSKRGIVSKAIAPNLKKGIVSTTVIPESKREIVSEAVVPDWKGEIVSTSAVPDSMGEIVSATVVPKKQSHTLRRLSARLRTSSLIGT